MPHRKFLTAAALLALIAGAAAFAVAGADAGPAPHHPPVPSPTSVRKIDEYGNIRFSDEKARLDNFAFLLLESPETTGYIVAYGGRRARPGEARRKLERAKWYLVAARKIPAERLVTIDGGYRETLMVELYALPSDAEPVTAAPTVDPAEVEIIREGPPRRGRRGRGAG